MLRQRTLHIVIFGKTLNARILAQICWGVPELIGTRWRGTGDLFSSKLPRCCWCWLFRHCLWIITADRLLLTSGIFSINWFILLLAVLLFRC